MTPLEVAQTVGTTGAIVAALGLSSAVWFRLGKVLGMAEMWVKNSARLDDHSVKLAKHALKIARNTLRTNKLEESHTQIAESIVELRRYLGGRIDSLHGG